MIKKMEKKMRSILTYGGHGKNGYSFFENETLVTT